jgi:hypothetical protein
MYSGGGQDCNPFFSFYQNFTPAQRHRLQCFAPQCQQLVTQQWMDEPLGEPLGTSNSGLQPGDIQRVAPVVSTGVAEPQEAIEHGSNAAKPLGQRISAMTLGANFNIRPLPLTLQLRYLLLLRSVALDCCAIPNWLRQPVVPAFDNLRGGRKWRLCGGPAL